MATGSGNFLIAEKLLEHPNCKQGILEIPTDCRKWQKLEEKNLLRVFSHPKVIIPVEKQSVCEPKTFLWSNYILKLK